MNLNNGIFSGTSNLVLPVPQSLYPPEFIGKSRLEYYSSLFNSVEINSSFYKNPKAATVAKWADSAVDHFQFTFKLSKAITHTKGLDFNPDDVSPFLETINNIGSKKGCLLIQFPPSLKMEYYHKLEELLETIKQNDENNDWKIAIELRNESWHISEVYELLKEHNACLVIHDIPASATPITTSTSDFKYVRFHGPEPRYRGSYSEEFLERYANQIMHWKREGQQVYVYFNNTMGDAVKNLQTLNSYLQG